MSISAYHEKLLEARELHRDGASRDELVQFFKDNIPLNKSQRNKQIKKIIEGTDDLDGPDSDSPFEVKDPYLFNPTTDEYVYFTYKLSARDIKLTRYETESILRRYSDYDNNPDTIQKIADTANLDRQELEYILKAHGMTHAKLPITEETCIVEEQEEVNKKLIRDFRIEATKKFRLDKWEEVQKGYNEWLKIKAGQLDVLEQFVQSFEFKHMPVEIHKAGVWNKKRAFIFVLSDLHFGAYSDPKELFYGDGWNIDKALQYVKDYVDEFVDYLHSINSEPVKIYLVIAGDIAHSTSGLTTKGTKVEAHPLGVDQILYAYNGFDYLLQCLLHATVNNRSAAIEIEVIDTEGNHDYIADFAIVQFLARAYRDEKRVKFNKAYSRWVPFKVMDSLFVVEHGSSAFYKSKVPKSGSNRKAYVQDVLIQAKKMYPNTKHNYFLTADQHNFEHSESNHFEFIRFSTPMHDKYADQLNLYSRPRQTVLDVRVDGVKADIHFGLQ